MRLKEIKTHVIPISALIFFTLVFLFYFLNSSAPAHDITSAYFPYGEVLKISAKEYGDFWPLWTPYGFSGSPLLMKPHIGLDSLYGVLLLTIPSTIIALKLTYVLLFLITGISMYSLMIYLKVGRRFALISALVYMLNGHITKLLVWGWLTTIAGYALLPLAFLFGMKSLKEGRWVQNGIITAIIFAALFRLNPDMKVTMWLGLLFGLYLIFNLLIRFSKRRLVKTALVSLLIVAVFFGLSAQRMIPNMDFIKVTSRGENSWQTASGRPLHYKDMWNRLVEPFYSGMPKVQREGAGDHIGLLAFLLVILAIYTRHKNKTVLFFSLGALFSIFVASNTLRLYYLLWRFSELSQRTASHC